MDPKTHPFLSLRGNRGPIKAQRRSAQNLSYMEAKLLCVPQWNLKRQSKPTMQEFDGVSDRDINMI